MAFTVALILMVQFEGAFQQGLARNQPQMSEEDRMRLSIGGLCVDPAGLAAIGKDTCDLYAMLVLMGQAALVTGLPRPTKEIGKTGRDLEQIVGSHNVGLM